MTIKEVADIVDAEGLEYAIMHYLDEEDISSMRLKKAIIKAKKALEKVVQILEPVDYEEDEDTNDED